MIDPLVRPATADDAVELRRLAREARALLVDRRGGQRWLATHPEPHWDRSDVIVAHIDGVVVGYLVLSIVGDVAAIVEVYVTPAAREVGFGDALIEAAVSSARAAGASVLEGEALPGDRDTKNLYERAGITARLITVSAPI